MTNLKNDIWQELTEVPLPGGSKDIATSGLVRKVTVQDGHATLYLNMRQLTAEGRQELEASLDKALGDMAGLESISLQAAEVAASRPRLPQSEPEPGPRLPGIRRVIAVGSGKGGVGKSTITVNLAVALAKQGLRVGLMDADAYGPNIPRMMGVGQLPKPGGGKIRPAEAHGVQLVSIGFMVQPDTPLVWRGPMTDKMVKQFLLDVGWGELDVLLVDLPPSTGDIPISLAKHARVDGAIVVVTPQNVAVDDARKAIGMFHMLKVPVLGVVENMSYFVCGECDTRHHLFGKGGGRGLASAADIPFLGEVPLEPVVRDGGDSGWPAALRTDSTAGAAFRYLAQSIWQTLEGEQQS